MTNPADIFLSYNREDQATARHFAEGFERAGFSVWWDVTLKSGEDFDQVTEQALESAKAVVVLWSKKSVAAVRIPICGWYRWREIPPGAPMGTS